MPGKATDVLMTEHRIIERMLAVLERAGERLERGEPLPAHLFEQAGEFLRRFADRCHHGKEEDLLFKALGDHGLPVEGGPIGVMLREHEQGRAHVRALREQGAEYAAGCLADPEPLLHAARGFVSLLREHIQKEDNVLYRMADQVLSDEEQEALAAAFERVESESMGAGEHERYHALLDELEAAVPD